MIAEEGLPRLQWPILPGHHVDRNRGLGDLDAQFEQFAIGSWELPTAGSQNSFFELVNLSARPKRLLIADERAA
jgi:hypothetical protein